MSENNNRLASRLSKESVSQGCQYEQMLSSTKKDDYEESKGGGNL
jgi:hypothetical protein